MELGEKCHLGVNLEISFLPVQATSVTTSLEQSILWKRGGVFLPAVRQKASRFSIGSQETFQFDMLILTHYQCINSYTLSMQEHQELPKMPLP